jgi:hypothetical protein
MFHFKILEKKHIFSSFFLILDIQVGNTKACVHFYQAVGLLKAEDKPSVRIGNTAARQIIVKYPYFEK